MKFLNRDAFNALTPAQQRVAIAEDVIIRLEADMLLPSCGSLLYVPGANIKTDIRSTLNNPSQAHECYACAKGALIVSWIGNFNHYQYSHLGAFSADLREQTERNNYPEEILEIFGRKMLDLMEIEFEDTIYSWSDKPFEDYTPTHKYHGDLREIMENIVANKGEFIP